MRLLTRRIALGLSILLLAGCALERGVAPMRVSKLFVSHRTVPCMSWFGPITCLEVRWPGAQEWTLFSGAIEGFTPEPGFTYAIEIEIFRLPPPIPADGSDVAYRLRRIIWRAMPEIAASRGED